MRRLMPVSARAGIVVTGTEVLTGRVQDRNGPWIADRLLELGVELAHITICGDRRTDIEAQLRFMADQGVDLIVTSGGLGPTADDMTVEMVARFCGRELVLDDEVEEKIANILKRLMGARNAALQPGSFESIRAANRKQAMIPAGSEVLDPVGTAPGVVVPGKPTVIVLPGPPRELQPMWQNAIQTVGGSGSDRRPDHLSAGDAADVRAARVRAGRNPACRRKVHPRLRQARDHHLLAARGDRDGHPLRARRRRRVRPADAAAARHARTPALLRRRFQRRRSGRPIARRSPDSDRGILYRGAAGGTADRPARVVGVCDGRCGELLQRGESRSCSASTRR